MNTPAQRFWMTIASWGGASLTLSALPELAKLGETAAAWVQAIGSVAAIAGAAWIAGQQSRDALSREERARAADRGAAIVLAGTAVVSMSTTLKMLSDPETLATERAAGRGVWADDEIVEIRSYPAELLRDAQAVNEFLTIRRQFTHFMRGVELLLRPGMNEEQTAQLMNTLAGQIPGSVATLASLKARCAALGG